MANPRHNKQTTNRRGAMGGGMMKRAGYGKGKLVGNQSKLDVAKPFGTLDKKDFKKLGKKSWETITEIE